MPLYFINLTPIIYWDKEHNNNFFPTYQINIGEIKPINFIQLPLFKGATILFEKILKKC